MQGYAPQRTSDLATHLTISEAAARLRCSPDTIRRRIKAGALPAVLFAGKYRIAVEDLDGLLRGAA
jgi:excisionase family DNA binding protein